MEEQIEVKTTNYLSTLTVRNNEVKIDMASSIQLSVSKVFEYRTFLQAIINRIYALQLYLDNSNYPEWLESKGSFKQHIKDKLGEKVRIFANVIIVRDENEIDVYELLSDDLEAIFYLRKEYAHLKDKENVLELLIPYKLILSC